MRMFLTKTFAHSKRGPYTCGLICPFLSVLFFMMDYHFNQIISISQITELTYFGGIGFTFLLFSPFVMGICSKRIEIIFLKHDTEKTSIQDSFALLDNMMKILYGSLVLFPLLLIGEFLVFGKTITIQEVSNFETNLWYTGHMVTLFIILMSLLSIIPRTDYKFKFGFARICLKFSISNETGDTEKIEYLAKGINSYNSFLGKNSHMNLKHPDIVTSRLMCETSEKRKYLIERLEKSFDRVDLGPLDQIKKIISIKNPEDFFVGRIKFGNIQKLITISASIVAILYFGSQIFNNFLIDFISQI